MQEEQRCARCQAPLASDAPAEVCPKCLLEQGLKTESFEPGALGAGGRFVAPPAAELAPHFPQLEILELVGSGGMGAVYKARQPALDRIVALKILPPVLASDATFAERLSREARAMARLCHAHIVWIFEFGQADGIPYLVMEYVDGVNLRDALRSGHMRPEQALAIVPQICDALAYAHGAGVVHRDIKPENVLLDRQGQVKIADFGLARLLADSPSAASLSASRQALGTPLYMAPEQLERPNEVDHRADIYALGVVFYEMLTGELPIGRFAPPSAKSDVDARLDDVVHKTLEKDPQRRYQSAGEVKTDVTGISAGRGSRAGGSRAGGVSVGQVWRDWRAEWQLDVLQVVKAALLCVYVICMLAFFSVDGNQGMDNRGQPFYSHMVGAPRPWLHWQHYTSGSKGDLRFDSEAWLSLAAGLAAYYAFWRIRKSQTGDTRRFRLPWSHVAFWLAVALVAIGSGLDARTHEMAMRLWTLRIWW